ncbi:WxL domain-containing protein [Listeria costaricensis]|uniref:WxL domain-containing protein n=1 Tax=Listeria costaricensis TaxID=2026604 RepID=UPI000C079370|nr:WxL domain-containing protein [Listeria costaricensis]
MTKKNYMLFLFFILLFFALVSPIYTFAENKIDLNASTTDSPQSTSDIAPFNDNSQKNTQYANEQETSADTSDSISDQSDAAPAPSSNLKSSQSSKYITMADNSKIEYGFSSKNSQPCASKPYVAYYDPSGNRTDFEFFQNGAANYTQMRIYSHQYQDQVIDHETNFGSDTIVSHNTNEVDAQGNPIYSITCKTKLDHLGSTLAGISFTFETTLTPRTDGLIHVSTNITNSTMGAIYMNYVSSQNTGFIWAFDAKINNVNYPIKAIGSNRGMYVEDGVHQLSFLTTDVDSWSAGQSFNGDTYDEMGYVEKSGIFSTFNRSQMISNPSDAVQGKEIENLNTGSVIYNGANSGVFLEWDQIPLLRNESRTINFDLYFGALDPPTITLDQKSTMTINQGDLLKLSGTWTDPSSSSSANFYYSIDDGKDIEFLNDYPENESVWGEFTVPESIIDTLSYGKHTIKVHCVNTLGMESNVVSLDFIKSSAPTADPVPQTVPLGTDVSQMTAANFVTNLSSDAKVVGFAADGIPSTQFITGSTPVKAKVVIQKEESQATIEVPVNVTYGDSLAIPSTKSGTDGAVLTLHHGGVPTITATYGNNQQSSLKAGPFTMSYYHTNDAGNIAYSSDGANAFVYQVADDSTTSVSFQSSYKDSSGSAYPSQTVRYGDIVVIESKAATLYNDDDSHPTVPALKDNKRAFKVTDTGFVPLDDLPLGELVIKQIDSLDFGTQVIPQKYTRFANQASSRQVIIDDTRACEKNWRLTVAQTAKFKSDAGNELQLPLYYVPNGSSSGSSLTIGTAQQIYSYNSTDPASHECRISWDQNHGFFLQANAGEALTDKYTTNLEWQIITAP